MFCTPSNRWATQVDGTFLAELRESDLVDSIGMEHKLHLKKLILARQKLTPLSASEQSMASSVRREDAAKMLREDIPDIDTAFSQVHYDSCKGPFGTALWGSWERIAASLRARCTSDVFNNEQEEFVSTPNFSLRGLSYCSFHCDGLRELMNKQNRQVNGERKVEMDIVENDLLLPRNWRVWKLAIKTAN